MTKTKKIISAVILAVVIVISCLTFMACGKDATSKDSFQLIENTLATYKENKMFGNGTVQSVQTNYLLSSFQVKNASGTLVNDDEKYPTFIAIGLNYIEDNYKRLDGIEVKYDYNSLNKKVNKLNSAYNGLCEEYNNLKSCDSDAGFLIYNGYFARYKLAARSFINEVYSVAYSLGEFLTSVDGDGIGETEVGSKAFNYYLEYNKFLITNDLKNFFMDSAQGKKFDETLYKDAESMLSSYCTKLANNNGVSLTVDEATAVKELFEAVSTDRNNANKSLNKFSLNDFYTIYESEIDAYEKTLADARIYYHNLETYFNSTGILEKLQDYVEALY